MVDVDVVVEVDPAPDPIRNGSVRTFFNTESCNFKVVTVDESLSFIESEIWCATPVVCFFT